MSGLLYDHGRGLLVNPQLREGRKADLEKHVAEVNSLLQQDTDQNPDEPSRKNGDEGEEDERNGVSHATAGDREAEYLDEDLHTTVTVEAVDVSRDGLHNIHEDESDEGSIKSPFKQPPKDHAACRNGMSDGQQTPNRAKISAPKKKKKKKFRYESRAERKVTKYKERSKNSAQARDRKS